MCALDSEDQELGFARVVLGRAKGKSARFSVKGRGIGAIALLALLTALVIVVGMRILGSLLISSLIIFPSSIAMKVEKTYRSVSILAAIESVVAFLIGFFMSYLFSLPTGASIVAVHMIFFVIASGVKGLRAISDRRG